MNKEAVQQTLFGPATSCGKTSPVRSRPRKGKTSASSFKKSAELRTTDYQYLDLRTGAGNLLGPYWEKNSPSLGEFSMLNTGVSPSVAKESSLSQILEAKPHPRYFLSRTACLGILRRAKERGKELPPQLEKALLRQASVSTDTTAT